MGLPTNQQIAALNTTNMTIATPPMSFFWFSVKCLFSMLELFSVYWDALTIPQTLYVYLNRL